MNLRDLVDGHTVYGHSINAAAPKAKSPSPVASHVASHMTDPVGATRDAYSKLTQKKLEYDQAREEAQRSIAPVYSTLNHLTQMHGLIPGTDTPPMAGAQPGGGMQPNPDDPEQQYDEQGNPVNMTQQPGQPNMPQRPSQVGTMPGVAPGPAQSAMPGKMGMPQPGGKGVAPKPKGNKSMPGAKGPGDPKVANKANKAQDTAGKGREIKLNIKGSGDLGRRVLAGGSNRLETQFGLSSLMAGGPGSGRRKQTDDEDEKMNNARELKQLKDKEYFHGLDSDEYDRQYNLEHYGRPDMAADVGTTLHEKSTNPGDEAAMNPVVRANRKRSRAAKRGWSTKSHGHLSAKEKKAHWGTVRGLKK